MFFNLKVTAFEVLAILFWCYGPFASGGATSNIYLSSLDAIVLPHQAENVLHRAKRQGGGGIIPFRPLFVYRQQQREMQEKWKEEEARKKLKQQSLQYQQYQQTIQQNQQLYQTHRPPTASSYYGKPTAQYSSFNYPSSSYESYDPSSQYKSYDPSYYGRYEYEQKPAYRQRQRKPSSNYYYQDYYDGYEYSYF